MNDQLRIKYLPNVGETQVVSGQAQLAVFGVDMQDAFKLEDKLWIFIRGHQHFVLREHYRECKTAQVRRPYHDEVTHDQSAGFPILVFGSAWEHHKDYLGILIDEFKLDIEGLPG